MSTIIKCSSCDASLNLPPEAEGRKVKCPRCGVKFLVNITSPPDPSAEPDRPSTVELRGSSGYHDLPVLPDSGADLRETFNLPLMRDEDLPHPKPARAQSHSPAASAVHKGTHPGASGMHKGVPSGPNGRGTAEVADAAALFDEPPAPRKRKVGGDARAQARRCPTCGGVVPMGMSLCQSCGLDLDTGMRVDLDEDYAPPAPRDFGPPVPIIVVGGLSLAASVALVVYALVLWGQGTPGALYFVPVAGFGVFAALQFLRRKSVRLLLAALSLGAAIDMAALVFMPIYQANADVRVVESTDDNPDSAGETIMSPADELDTQKLVTGFILLALYAVVSIYLLSPGVHKHLKR